MALKPKLSTEKHISDLFDCVSSLKEQFQDENNPITDENILLQKLCSKLEFILQHGLKDKTSILGNKKDYWDYFCQCLASRKYIHDGIRYVKLKSEVKTSKGKGRAFLRFCLVHGCLADSLQQCFLHDQATGEWYQDWAISLQKKTWPTLISSLYDLSEVRFDLVPDCFDLDISWPTFSRGTYEQRFSWKPPSRSISISSLNSQVQMEHPLGATNFKDFTEEGESECSVENGLLRIELNRSELRGEVLQERVSALEASEAQLRKQMSHSQLPQELSVKTNGECVERLKNSSDIMCFNNHNELGVQTEVVDGQDTTHWQQKLSASELEVRDLLLEREQLLSVISESASRAKKLEEDKVQLLSDIESLKADLRTSSVEAGSMAETITQLGQQVEESQAKLEAAESSNFELLKKLEEVQASNDNLKDIYSEVKSTNNKVSEEVSHLKEEISKSDHRLNESVRERNELNDLVIDLQKQLEISKATGNELKIATDTILILEEKTRELSTCLPDVALISKITDIEMINISLSQDLESTTSNLQCQITSLCSEKDQLCQTIKKLENENQKIVTKFLQQKELASKANDQLHQADQIRNVLVPLTREQETVSHHLHLNTNRLVIESQQLSDNMKSLASILFSIAKGNYATKGDGGSYSKEVDTNGESSPPLDVASDSVVSLVSNSARTVSKLKELLMRNEQVEMILQTCQLLCCDLIGLAREHKRKLALEHFDLQGTKQIVDTLANEHKKLQSAEAILKYELHEKRKLLSSLRHQLESTREEWNRNRLKTAQSELEWHSLRDDFANRHKQSSEESGFAEDKQCEDPSSEHSEASLVSVSEMTPEDAVEDSLLATATCSNASPSSICEGAESSEPPAAPRTRLDILEEQYQLLYVSLLRSSKRSEVLEQRLEAILGHTESFSRSRSSRAINSETQSHEESVEPSTDLSSRLEVAEPDETPSEDVSQSDNGFESGLESDQPVSDSVSVDHLVFSDTAVSNGGDSYLFEPEVNGNGESDLVLSSTEDPVGDVRKKTLENFLTKMKDEKLARNAKEADLRTEIEVLLSEKLDLERKVLNLQQEKQQVWSKESEFRKRAEFIFRQERDSFESKLSSLNDERSELRKEIEDLKHRVEQNEDELKSTEVSLQETKEKLLERESFLNQQIETLKFQMSAESMKYERALKHYNEQESGIVEMKEKINSQELLIESLEDSLTEIREERRSEQERQWQELEELQLSLSTRDEECTAMNEELKKTRRELDETHKLFGNLKTASKRDEKAHLSIVTNLEGVLTQMKSDNDSLKMQIIKLTKDKDVLWKRSEALSQLQFSPTRDRWMSDSEVTECLSCKSTFSFILRKHHCRLCGRIFCHNCANHWAMMASSSRRARICTECYSEHIDKEKTQQPSLLPTEPDGSEEEVVDAALKFTSAPPPTDNSLDSVSVDSLPVSNRCSSSPSVMEALLEVSGSNDCSVNLEQTFLSDEFKMDFDVISDEEIARSLSACSPYSPVSSPTSATDTEMQSCGTRTIQDILLSGTDGVSGEIWVNAGLSYGVPVLLDQEDVILIWEFTSDPKSIAFSVAYREERSDALSQETLLQTTRVQSHLRPVQGHLIAKHPGLYILIFSNQFSKYLAKKVSYTLKIQNSSEGKEETNS